jgi:hypothetical protein
MKISYIVQMFKILSKLYNIRTLTAVKFLHFLDIKNNGPDLVCDEYGKLKNNVWKILSQESMRQVRFDQGSQFVFSQNAVISGIKNPSFCEDFKNANLPLKMHLKIIIRIIEI